MASHYELHQTGQNPSNQKPFIDFYRQQDQQQHREAPNTRGIKQSNQQWQQNAFQASSKDFQVEGTTGTVLNAQEFQDNQHDPSPISGVQGLRYRGSGQNDNYLDSNFNTQESKKEELKNRQVLIDRQVVSKRRSIENKEAVSNNRQKDLLSSGEYQGQNRLLVNGVKSALTNYGTQGQTATGQNIKQINKNTKVERDPVMEISQQNYQNKRSLAKSQSQNRLLLVSQEALMNKNNPYQDTYPQGDGGQIINPQDKNSFFKDQLNGTGNNQVQDLLYKQHMQYSANGGNQKGWLLKASNHNLLLSRMTTKSECTFCNKTSAGGMVSQSIIPHHCSAIYCSKDQQGMMIQNNLSKKYSTNRDYYNLKIVNDLIYNENTHIVSIFKDYLILDDINEFLKRSYTQQETKVRLPKLCSFYEKYSQVFPNYVVLPESKYMFKNIQRKQKLIDEQYQLQEELAKKQHQTLLDEDKLFNTKFYNSYYSNMGADISMNKKQYEDQAKQISINAGKKPSKRIDQMRIDELVDRFLMKDSESNIQLFTSVALDFSGFTNSFINPSQQSLQQIQIQEKTPVKQSAQKTASTINNRQSSIQQLNKPQSIKPLTTTGSSTNLNGKKSLENTKKTLPQQTNNLNTVNTVATAKRQKNSFNNNQQQTVKSTTSLVPKLDSFKVGQSGNNGQESTKTTPRLQKPSSQAVQVQNIQDINTLKPQIQSSPGTKQAIDNYLLNCNIDLQDDQLLRSNQKMQIDHQFQTQKLAVGPLLSPGNNIIESPSLKSPNVITQKQPLQQASSQSSLLTNQQQFQNSLSQNSRQAMKSQCLMPTVQQITSMKKTTRLSNGGGGIKQANNHRKNISPVPSQQQVNQQNQQYVAQVSRNQQVATNSTQKSAKSINTHAKYLSGGNEQYQKLLVNINQQQIQNQQQNSYATNYDTMNSNLIQSSTKKSNLLQQQRSKQDLILETFIGSQNSHHKLQQPPMIKPPDFNDNLDAEAVTGDDCDDFGIADERFASPDANNLVFQTLDDNMHPQTQGRKSLEGIIGNHQNPQQMLLLTSSEDKLFSQSNNFDQIKKHLEQYITINHSTTNGNQGGSIPSQQTMTFDATSQPSNSKKYPTNQKSCEKYDEVKQSLQSAPGYNRDGMTQSAHQQLNHNSQDQNNSRNGTGQKHFESLKQKIRGVFDNNQNIDPPSIQSANKTPNKSSTHSKKSTHQIGQSQNMILQQNRMSIESGNMLMVMPASNTNQGGIPLSSTSANGRQLSFSQTSFSNNASNYRSITNLQQRKGSNINTKKELSIESKRLSGQNRQSFKDLSQQQIIAHHQVQNTLNEQQKIIKRSATGKTLNIQDVNSHSHTFGQFQSNYLQSAQSTATLQNPTFIANNQITNNSKQYATANHQQQNSISQTTQQQLQQQAANTVRVMTPSYSLASLSKLISPTTTTSPLTMTVTLANGNNAQAINRKQIVSSKGKLSALGVNTQNYNQYNPSGANLTSSHSQQNFLISDKGSKLISSSNIQNPQRGIISSKANVKSTVSTRQNNTLQANSHPIQISNTINHKLGRQQVSQQHISIQQSNSLQTFQATPRAIDLLSNDQDTQQEQRRVLPLQNNQYENSQNLSCTVSIENNSTAKAIESKHPKFMRTIEEYSTLSNQGPTPSYNTMLSASMGHQKTGNGLANSISQAQLDFKQQKQKIQTVVNSNQASIKRTNIAGQTLSSSASVSHFKSPSQQLNSKKQLQGRYLNM